MDNEKSLSSTIGCFIWLIISLTLGAWTVIYSVSVLFHQHISYGWAFLISFFTGWFTITLAFTLWILQLAGIHI
jgi:uncharacterized membrane protein